MMLCSPFVDRPVHVVPNDVHRKEASVHDCDSDRPEIQRNHWNPNWIGINAGQNTQIQQKYKHEYTLTQGRLCQPCSHSIQWRKWPRSQRWQRRSQAKGTRHKASKAKNYVVNKWKYEYAYKSNDNLDNVGDNDKSYLIKEVDISNHGDADEEVPKVREHDQHLTAW